MLEVKPHNSLKLIASSKLRAKSNINTVTASSSNRASALCQRVDLAFDRQDLDRPDGGL